MIRRLLHYSFIIPTVAFLLHQIIQKIAGISAPWFDNYLDPFCFGAIVPPLLLEERAFLFKRTYFTKLEFIILLLILVLFSEILLPFVSSNFVADSIDAILILIGGSWFLWLRVQ
jgi:hypothetical protein